MGGDSRVEVVVLVVCYNGGRDVEECLASLADHPPPPYMTVHTVVVDNASSDGSADRIAASWPDVEVVRSDTNLGFAGGNNLGWDAIQRRHPRAAYLMLLNQDTLVGANWLEPLVEHLDAHPDAGAVQPLIMLHPETELINTGGNRCHYLGFTFVTRYRQRPNADEPVRELDAVSGAACLLRTDLLRRFGLFESGMFMYCEDVDLSWKLRLANYRLFVIPDSRIYHKYEPDAPQKAYYFLERNRWWLLLTYYRWRTLLLLVPALVTMEIGQLVYATMHGLGGLKFRSWAWFWRSSHLRQVASHRRAMRRVRQVRDRWLMRRFVGDVVLPAGTPSALKYLGNPLLRGYWLLARPLIRW